MIKSYTRRLLEMAPRWLRNGEGGKILTAIGSRVDHEIERVVFALKAQHPGLVEFDALDYISQDRLLRRGATEADSTFASRLLTWRREHSRRGNAYALLNQLAVFMAPTISPTSITYRNGTRYSLAADGTITRSTVTDYDLFGSANQWARYWIQIEGNAVSNDRIDDIKRIVYDWHAEHCFGYGSIINGDRPWDKHTAWDLSWSWDSPGTSVSWVVETFAVDADLQPQQLSFMPGGPFTLQKNWMFGINGNIQSYTQLNNEFTYHDIFNTISNGTNYGAITVRAPGSEGFGVWNWEDIGLLSDQQPVDPGNRYREFTANSLICKVMPLDPTSVVVGPASTHNAGCGSFMSKLTFPAGGARFGQDIVWETKCRILDAPNGYWFALWIAGPQWDGGPEIDLIEAFSSYPPNVKGDLFNTNAIGGSNDTDYYSTGWDVVLEPKGIPGYAIPDGAQSLRNWHTFTLYYQANNHYTCLMDGTVIQSGVLDWKVPSSTDVPPLSFLFDFGFGHTEISPSNTDTISDISLAPLRYEIEYSRVWTR